MNGIEVVVDPGFQILGSVKLHIGDSWGKMKTFALGHFYGDTGHSENWRPKL